MTSGQRPAWSGWGKYCAYCARPFPTEADAAHREAGNCQSSCYCQSLCWAADEGGECDEAEFDGGVAVYVALRAMEEEAERLQAQVQELQKTVRWLTTPRAEVMA